MASADSFNVADWLRTNPPQSCNAAQISQPTRLGVGWTKHGHAKYTHGDASGLAALQLPSLPVDLNEGIESFVPKASDSHVGVEILIREALVSPEATLSNCHILTFRNNLNKIMGTVFDGRDAWTVDACMPTIAASDVSSGLNNLLFLDIVNTTNAFHGTASGPSHETFLAWGYQFEAKCTGADHADPNTEYGVLVSFKLSGKMPDSDRLNVFLGAEIDAYEFTAAATAFPVSNSHVDQQGVPPLSRLREIKTFPLPMNPGQLRTTHRHRHPKWWLQSHLAGVPALVLGARDRKGVVREIHTVATADLPRISWKNNERWSPQQALAFGADVLGWMRQVAGKFPGQHLRFQYIPESQAIHACVVDGGKILERITAALAEKKACEKLFRVLA